MPLLPPFSPAERPLFLMDGTAYMYRGFYANSNLQRSDGFPTGALTVVTRILLRILRQERPASFVFVKDGHGKNFRHEIYPEYKANRTAMPEALAGQIEPILRMVKALGLHCVESQGCEADDCIASLAGRWSKQGPVVLVSGDKDLKQCLADNVVLWDPAGKDEKLVTKADVEKEFGIPLSLWPDLQALTGDAVDNIPGVPGIGPKTAIQILKDFPGLEAIRDRYELLSPKHQKKLEGHLESMFTWRRLTTLALDRCGELTANDLAVRPVDLNEALAIAREFELRALMRDIMALGKEEAQPAGMTLRPERTWPAGGKAGQAKESVGVPDRDEDTIVRATRGATLLDLARSSLTSGLETLKEAAALPDCTGCDVACIRPEGPHGPLVVAVRDKNGSRAKGGSHAREFLYAGDDGHLATWAASCETLVVEDAKPLLHEVSPWKTQTTLRVQNGGLHDLSLAAHLFAPEENTWSWQRLVGQASLPMDMESKGPASTALAMETWGRERLERDGLQTLYTELELPLTAVLADMEDVGIRIDMTAFESFLGEVRQELSMLTQTIHEIAGENFNMRSSRQLGELLYDRLGLKHGKKTRTGQYSTSQETLESLAGHPLVDAILRFRKLEKLRSTYLEPLPRLTDRKGRLHTTFNQKATATGRLSSSNPNLQNIPVRGALGKRMRACFVAERGKSLIACDYSQIELRVLAHASQDKELLSAFARNEDIHTRTAALVYECEPEAVTNEQRRNAKTINFGLIYGMGAQKLAREIGVSTAGAKDFIARYFARLTGLKAFYERVEEEAQVHGFVTTLGGRRRYLPNITSNNSQEQALARRQAINTVIQGSAADIIKMAMLQVWKDNELARLGARMLLQVHDELVLEAPQANAKAVAERVCAIMEGIAPQGQPFEPKLKVDAGVGPDWGTAH